MKYTYCKTFVSLPNFPQISSKWNKSECLRINVLSEGKAAASSVGVSTAYYMLRASTYYSRISHIFAPWTVYRADFKKECKRNESEMMKGRYELEK